MSELDEAWELALGEAERRAREAGRTDLAEYLSLRASNDLIRQTALDWLMNTFTILAGEANRRGASIQMSSEDNHRFAVGNATMVGRLLTLRNGVRTLSIEGGWPRTPGDGFIRGGGLACANLRHLGIKKANAALLLRRAQSGAPRWAIMETPSQRVELDESGARAHIAILLQET